MKIVARTQTESQVKMSPLQCFVAKLATQVSTQMNGAQLSGDLKGVLAISH